MRRDIFQAIADPTSRAIITLIAIQAMTPNAIAEQFEHEPASCFKTYSNTYRMRTGKTGTTRQRNLLSLEIEKMKEIDKWLDQFRKIWETQFNQLDKVLSTIKKQKK